MKRELEKNYLHCAYFPCKWLNQFFLFKVLKSAMKLVLHCAQAIISMGFVKILNISERIRHCVLIDWIFSCCHYEWECVHLPKLNEQF